MELTARHLAGLQGLLPSGAAWPRAPGAVLTRVLEAWATGFARAHARLEDLHDEADPRATHDLLPDWERVCGLPDACTASTATTVQERRQAVVTKLTAGGGQSIAYFQGIAASLGYATTVTEYRPFVCGASRCGDLLNGGHATRHHWKVHVAGPRYTPFRAGVSQCGDRLGKISRAEDLECRLTRLKPAHTHLIMSYEGA